MSREEVVEKLLSLTVGDLREKLAHADSDWYLDEWVNDYDGLDDVEVEHDDDYDCDDDWDDEDYDNDYEDDDYEDEDDEDEDDTPSLSGDERELADAIVDDIDNGRYTLDTIKGVYAPEIVKYVETYID